MRWPSNDRDGPIRVRPMREDVLSEFAQLEHVFTTFVPPCRPPGATFPPPRGTAGMSCRRVQNAWRPASESESPYENSLTTTCQFDQFARPPDSTSGLEACQNRGPWLAHQRADGSVHKDVAPPTLLPRKRVDPALQPASPAWVWRCVPQRLHKSKASLTSPASALRRAATLASCVSVPNACGPGLVTCRCCLTTVLLACGCAGMATVAFWPGLCLTIACAAWTRNDLSCFGVNANIEDLLKIVVFDPEFVRVRVSAPAFMITRTPFDLRVVERNLAQGTGLRRLRSSDKSASTRPSSATSLTSMRAAWLTTSATILGEPAVWPTMSSATFERRVLDNQKATSSKSARIILATVVVSRKPGRISPATVCLQEAAALARAAEETWFSKAPRWSCTTCLCGCAKSSNSDASAWPLPFPAATMTECGQAARSQAFALAAPEVVGVVSRLPVLCQWSQARQHSESRYLARFFDRRFLIIQRLPDVSQQSEQNSSDMFSHKTNASWDSFSQGSMSCTFSTEKNVTEKNA